jgi:hypothetical protein
MTVPSNAPAPSGPLAGLRVLDISTVVAAATLKVRIDRLGAAINKIVQSPDIVEKFRNLGAFGGTDGVRCISCERGCALECRRQSIGREDRITLRRKSVRYISRADPAGLAPGDHRRHI